MRFVARFLRRHSLYFFKLRLGFTGALAHSAGTLSPKLCSGKRWEMGKKRWSVPLKSVINPRNLEKVLGDLVPPVRFGVGGMT